MKDAISYNDAKLFFQATRERIRLEVGTIYNYPTPSALSSFELVSLLKENQQDRQIIDELEYILIASDSHEFANNDEEIDSLEDILVKTNKVLKKIK